MLRHPLQGWEDLPSPYLSGRSYQQEYPRRWPWPLAAGAGFVAVLGYVLLSDDPAPGLSRRGWLTLALAALLLVQLSLHRRNGGGGWLARVTAEYAVVALLAVLLTLAATGVELEPRLSGQAAKQQTAKQQAVSRPSGRPGARATGEGCPPVRQVFAWVGCLWGQANPPQPKPGRALALSPPPPTRRTP
jgi:hypothetical protein